MGFLVHRTLVSEDTKIGFQNHVWLMTWYFFVKSNSCLSKIIATGNAKLTYVIDLYVGEQMCFDPCKVKVDIYA